MVCLAPTTLCDSESGCLLCDPGQRACEGDDVIECAADGQAWNVVEACGDGLSCLAGQCADACVAVAQQQSYLGCDFMAMTTINTGLSQGFYEDFAVAVGVPAGDEDAVITITRGANTIATRTVPQGTTQAITLPMVAQLQRPGSIFENADSVRMTDGAYEVHSTVPVVAYQWNPLHFSTSALAYSYTNDASLLLPEHALSTRYRVLTMPTWVYAPFVQYRGFAAIVATQDGTEVTFTSSTTTAAGDPAPLQPGSFTVLTMDRGDAVQILSGSQASHDLSGSSIEATAPVAVWMGHDCTYMPQDAEACDHLEEMAFPEETWGQIVVLAALEHPDGIGPAPARYRVLARENNTELTFDPAVTASTTLQSGEWAEFDTDESFAVTGSAPISVTQTMMGQNYLQAVSGGDPSMGTGVPWSQWRTSYDFLVPDTYTTNWLDVVVEAGGSVLLDGSALGAGEPVGQAGYEVLRFPVNPGPHHIETQDGQRFGITMYGYAAYTSYLLPAGLNLLR